MYGSSPKAPDPKKTAQAQFNYDLGSTQAGGIINNPNTYDPYGSTTYSQAGMETVTLPNGKSIQVPRYNQNTQLTPLGQDILNKQQNLASDSYDRASTLMDRNPAAGAQPWQSAPNTPDLQGGYRSPQSSSYFSFNLPGLANDVQTQYADPADFNESRERVETAMVDRSLGLLNQNRDAENARYAAMGITPGSERWDDVSDQYERSGNDIAMQAVLAGGQEQSRLLGEARAAGDFYNSGRGQQFGQRMGLLAAENDRRMAQGTMDNSIIDRNNQLGLLQHQLGMGNAQFNNNLRQAQIQEGNNQTDNEINRLVAILSGAQVQTPQVPGYFSQGMSSPDYTGMVNNNYAQKVAAHNAELAGVTNLIGGGINLWRGA